MRLIDADALIETVHDMTHHPDNYLTVREIEDTVEREPTIGCWISAKDRLPDSDDGVVLAIAEYDDGWCEVLAWRSEKTGWVSDDPLFQDGMEVTHWMPLPEPPEEVSGDD